MTRLRKITISNLKPVSYQLISYRRVTMTLWEYTYRMVLQNIGSGDATNVTAVLQNWPSQVTVVDGTTTFSTVPAGTQVPGTDTFTIRIDRSQPVANSDLTWRLSFTDENGTSWVLIDFPLF